MNSRDAKTELALAAASTGSSATPVWLLVAGGLQPSVHWVCQSGHDENTSDPAVKELMMNAIHVFMPSHIIMIIPAPDL